MSRQAQSARSPGPAFSFILSGSRSPSAAVRASLWSLRRETTLTITSPMTSPRNCLSWFPEGTRVLGSNRGLPAQRSRPLESLPPSRGLSPRVFYTIYPTSHTQCRSTRLPVLHARSTRLLVLNAIITRSPFRLPFL